MRILYAEGDANSPKFVAGALRAAGHGVELIVGGAPLPERSDAEVVILSDVPREKLGVDAEARLRAWVEAGTGLLVAGGWHSLGSGGYARSVLAEVLPVLLIDGDDRQNAPQGLFLRRDAAHEVLAGLPFASPPVLTGYNRVDPRPGAQVPLVGALVSEVGGLIVTLERETVPLLVLGTHGRGRVAVLATDPAPHWSGGWTDWGGAPIDVGEGEQVGPGYLRFLDQLCRWLGAP